MDYSKFTDEQLEAIQQHANAMKAIIKMAQPADEEYGYFYHYEEYCAILQIEFDAYREDRRRVIAALEHSEE